MDIKHEHFCIAYIANKGNGTAAYQIAYPNCSYAAARVGANRVLKMPEIQEYIAARRASITEELNITIESQLRDLELVKDRYKYLLELSTKEELTKQEKFQMEFLYNLIKVPTYVAAIAEQNRILGFHVNKELDQENQSSVQLYLPNNERETFDDAEVL